MLVDVESFLLHTLADAQAVQALDAEEDKENERI